jgi:hypothetical protein
MTKRIVKLNITISQTDYKLLVRMSNNLLVRMTNIETFGSFLEKNIRDKRNLRDSRMRVIGDNGIESKVAFFL